MCEEIKTVGTPSWKFLPPHGSSYSREDSATPAPSLVRLLKLSARDKCCFLMAFVKKIENAMAMEGRKEVPGRMKGIFGILFSS